VRQGGLHLTCYSWLRPLPRAGDAGRWVVFHSLMNGLLRYMKKRMDLTSSASSASFLTVVDHIGSD
jgi:hypothetical protein